MATGVWHARSLGGDTGERPLAGRGIKDREGREVRESWGLGQVAAWPPGSPGSARLGRLEGRPRWREHGQLARSTSACASAR